MSETYDHIAAMNTARDAYNESPAVHSLWRYQHIIDSAMTSALQPSATKTLLLAVAEHLPAACRATVCSMQRLPMARYKEMISVVLDREALFTCLAQEDGEKAVAWLCTERAFILQESGGQDKRRYIDTVLRTWLNRGLQDPTRPSLQETVALLYAGNMDALSLLDIEFTRNISRDMWWSHLPVLPRSTPHLIAPATQGLPNDLLL